MAEEKKAVEKGPGAGFSEADRAKARAWFKKAADCRERREYDYAIECYITGLGFWPEAVEEGHMPLHSLAVQRLQAGGKKPSMMESLKRSPLGRNPTQCMLNAEYLLAKDPHNASHLDALLKNANKAGLTRTVRWVTPLVFESLKRDKKPNKARFKAFRDALTESADRADQQGDAATACDLLEQAVASLEFLLSRMPGEEDLRQEQRDLSGKLAIVKGKYQEADSFRESLRDAEAQKILHDGERGRQAVESFEALVAAARKNYEEDPTDPRRVNALVQVLTRPETKPLEDEAIAVLMKAYTESRNYHFKQRADDIRLRQLRRQTRELAEQARASRSPEDEQQLRLAQMEELQTQLEIYRERVANYPTDLRLKYHFGKVLFNAGQFDEAIPVLQAAQDDPRSRADCQLMMGRAFLEKGNAAQAADVLKELLSTYELTDDLSKAAMYWLGRACHAAGRIEDARAAFGKLLRIDYNYAEGDARRRLDELNKRTGTSEE